MKAVSKSGRALEDAFDEHKGDFNIVMEAVSKTWEALEWASVELRA